MTTRLLARLWSIRAMRADDSLRSVLVTVIERREANVAVAMMVDNPEGSQEAYDKIRAHLGLEKPAGGIFHLAGPSPNGGWRVVEVWESEEEANRFFQQRFMPALRAVGLAGALPRREFWPVHNAMK
jgi:hypothetical protein